MRKVSGNILSVAMAVIVLITSNGIVVASHTCLKKSDTTVSLFKSQGCCGNTKKSCERSESSSVKSNCCISSVSFHKVNVNAMPSQKQVVEVQTLFAPVAMFAAIQTPAVVISSDPAKPPLLFSVGKDLLKQFSSFRI